MIAFRTPGRKKAAISPVLATIMLIAVTLIAGVAVAGFLFGLMGTFTSPPLVSATAASCEGSPETCTVSLQNLGSGNAAITGGCSLTYGGSTYGGTAVILSGSLRGGGTASVSCASDAGPSVSSGSQITGSISVGDGASAFFVTSAQ